MKTTGDDREQVVNLLFTMKIPFITSSLCGLYTVIIIVNKETYDRKSRVHEQVHNSMRM